MTLVFHRIPECGGDVITPWLESWLASKSGSLVVNHSAELASVKKAELRKKTVVSGPFGADMWSLFEPPVCPVILLRDPLDRIVSLYSRWHEAPAGSNLREIARRSDIYGFARDPHVLVAEFVDNAQTWTLFSDPAAKARNAREKCGPDKILAGAIERLSEFAVVGTYEKWEGTMTDFAVVLGRIFGDPPLPPVQPVEPILKSMRGIDRDRLAAALGPRVTLDIKLHRLVSERTDASIQAATRERRKAILGPIGYPGHPDALDPVAAYLLSRVETLEALLSRSEAKSGELSRESERLRASYRYALEQVAREQSRRKTGEAEVAGLRDRLAAASNALSQIRSLSIGSPESHSKTQMPG